MKNDIKSAAVVESEAQTLETYKAASAAHDVQDPFFHVSDLDNNSSLIVFSIVVEEYRVTFFLSLGNIFVYRI